LITTTLLILGISPLRAQNIDIAFYANDVHCLDLPDTLFSVNDVYFRAELEGLNSNIHSLKWYINEVEEEVVRDKPVWNKIFPDGEYEIEMWIRFEKDRATTITYVSSVRSVLKIKTEK